MCALKLRYTLLLYLTFTPQILVKCTCAREETEYKNKD